MGLDKLAREYAKSIILDFERHSDALEECMENFKLGFNFLTNIEVETDRIFKEEYTFNEDAKLDEKETVKTCLDYDFKAGLFYALLDYLGEDFIFNKEKKN